jgi:U4/U6.U5 tri-snRNP-associated protein 2
MQVFCLPDNYEVVDRSLDDVRHVLDPRFTPNDVARLDKVRVLHS